MKPLVSVVIPSYNHDRFISDAIDSVRAQTYDNVEIVVVDDGSVDNTRALLFSCADIRYVYQANGGLASARNTGLRISKGEYVVFLDADDVLASHAVEVGVRYLSARPSCAFVSGDYRLVGTTLEVLPKASSPFVDHDHYLALLRSNYIGMHATVMYRREAIIDAGGFNEGLRACEDYELYLRIARHRFVACHREIVADYRQHGTNMSRDAAFMLLWALKVHNAELPFVQGVREREAAFREGDCYLREYYGDQIFADVYQSLSVDPKKSIKHLMWLANTYPTSVVLRRRTREVVSSLRHRLRPKCVGDLLDPPVGEIHFGSFRRAHPICPAVDDRRSIVRAQADELLQTHGKYIRGDVLRIGAEGVPLDRIDDEDDERYDTVVCDMALHQAWDPLRAVRQLGRVLRPAGVVLATLPGVTVTSSNEDGSDFWRFTCMSARKLFAAHFDHKSIEIEALGSALTAVAALHRCPADTLTYNELRQSDPQFPNVMMVRATK